MAERFRLVHYDSLVIRMRGIHQAIVLVRGENGRHKQQAMLASLGEFITESGKLNWRGGIAPISRQIADSKLLSVQIVRDLRNHQHQISRRIVLVEMDEILQHC